MSGSTRLVILRHGRTEWNASKRYQGQTDIALDERGLAQAEAVAPVVASRFGIEAIWSSPLSRARQTAAAVEKVTGLTTQVDDRLMEINVGSWSGLTSDEMRSIDPAFLAAVEAGEDYRRSPEGETATEAGERMAAGLRSIAEAHRGQTVLVAGHGLAIRMGIGQLLDWSYQAAWWLGPARNCHWAEVELWTAPGLGERWRLNAWNVGS